MQSDATESTILPSGENVTAFTQSLWCCGFPRTERVPTTRTAPSGGAAPISEIWRIASCATTIAARARAFACSRRPATPAAAADAAAAWPAAAAPFIRASARPDLVWLLVGVRSRLWTLCGRLSGRGANGAPFTAPPVAAAAPTTDAAAPRACGTGTGAAPGAPPAA